MAFDPSIHKKISDMKRAGINWQTCQALIKKEFGVVVSKTQILEIAASTPSEKSEVDEAEEVALIALETSKELFSMSADSPKHAIAARACFQSFLDWNKAKTQRDVLSGQSGCASTIDELLREKEDAPN